MSNPLHWRGPHQHKLQCCHSSLALPRLPPFPHLCNLSHHHEISCAPSCSFVADARELRAKAIPEIPGFAPRLIIYLAKGPANSCGSGCDHWIAIEGNVDQEGASRIRRFLRDVKDTQRPIYLHSPGGAVEQAYAIGRLLRSRKAIARVGQTIVAACSSGTQVDDACLKIKTAGGEVQAEIVTHHAMVQFSMRLSVSRRGDARGCSRCRDGGP